MAAPTAAIVIVGDEILAGHTQDTNSHWIAKRLRTRGVRLLRVETIPDEAAEIDATLRRLLARDAPTFAFVVGGIGPTPDDRTYEGVARALGVELVVKAEHLRAMKRRVAAWGLAHEGWADPERSEAMRRMIRLPAGSKAMANPIGAALGCVARAGETRVVVLPGVPKELEAMYARSFERVHLARSRPLDATSEVEVHGAEARLWGALRAIETEFPSLRLGSYPQDRRRRVVLRLSGPPDEVARGVKRLRALLEALRGNGGRRRKARR